MWPLWQVKGLSNHQPNVACLFQTLLGIHTRENFQPLKVQIRVFCNSQIHKVWQSGKSPFLTPLSNRRHYTLLLSYWLSLIATGVKSWQPCARSAHKLSGGCLTECQPLLRRKSASRLVVILKAATCHLIDQNTSQTFVTVSKQTKSKNTQGL